MILYLALAPVFWLPSVAPGNLNLFKLFLIGAAVIIVLVIATSRGKFRLPPGLLGPIGFLVLMLVSAGGFIQAESSLELILRTKDYALAFITISTFFTIALLGFNAHKIFVASAVLISSFCLLAVYSKYFGLPAFSGPAEYDADVLWKSGFGAVRTGWSNGVALYVPILASLLFLDSRFKFALFIKAVSLIGITSVLASQVISSGRAGLLASLMGLTFLFLGRGGKRYLVLFGVSAIVLVILKLDYFVEQLRFVLHPDVQSSGSVLNDISTGRFYGAIAAIEKGTQSPLFGHGFGNFTFGTTEIHNLWLKFFVEAGVFLPLVLALIVAKILKITWRKKKLIKSFSVNSSLSTYEIATIRSYEAIIYMGILISMLEPRALLGAYQVSALWWCVAGFIVGYKARLAY